MSQAPTEGTCYYVQVTIVVLARVVRFSLVIIYVSKALLYERVKEEWDLFYV